MNNKILIAILALLIGVLLGLSLGVAKAADRPLPYTTPHITQKGKITTISWYNTRPGIYTVALRYEKCTPKFCISAMRIIWHKYVGIGNVRIQHKNKQFGQYIVY